MTPSDELVNTATGLPEAEAVTSVIRIRDGVETTLNRSFTDVTPGDDGVYVFIQGGQIGLAFNNTVRSSDNYLITVNTRPVNPGNPATTVSQGGKLMAYAAETDATEAVAGVRTPFTFSGQFNPAAVVTTLPVSATQTDFYNQQVFFIGGEEFTGAPVPGDNIAYDDSLGTHSSATYFTGMETPNWFKDENEKIALMGALGEVFAYLQEDDQSQKYFELFNKEIADLNNEDRVRDASGGNVQTQYTANGLI